MRRRFNGTERVALYLAAGGKCHRCGTELVAGQWHADHDIPYSRGGETDVTNGRALCATCNLKKGAKMAITPRGWQAEALEQYQAKTSENFLLVATPGAGKTWFSFMAFDRVRARGEAERMIVVVPSEHLKHQWAETSDKAGCHADPNWENRHGAWPRDFDVLCVTYQQVGAQPDLFRRLVSERGTFAVFDEIHHCGESLTWGDSIRHAFAPAARRLALSGTPFRSDSHQIPFVDYDGNVVRPDFTFGYADALRAGIVRPVEFPRQGGEAEWLDHRGLVRQAALGDPLDDAGVAQALCAVLDPRGGWLRGVVREAHACLLAARARHANAAALAVARDQAHARAVADIISEETGERVEVVVSDEPDAKRRLRRFEGSRVPWLVSVKMVSEGVDIPRLRVGLFATNVMTEVFFRQFVGRFIRAGGDTEPRVSSVFIPEHPQLTRYASEIKEECLHALDDDAPVCGPGGSRVEGAPSLFTPLTSTHWSNGATYGGEHYTAEEIENARRWAEADPGLAAAPASSIARLLRMGGAAGAATPERPATPRRDERDRSRARMKALVNKIARREDIGHAIVNSRLNRSVGIDSLTDASLDALRRREEIARRWLESGLGPA